MPTVAAKSFVPSLDRKSEESLRIDRHIELYREIVGLNDISEKLRELFARIGNEPFGGEELADRPTQSLAEILENGPKMIAVAKQQALQLVDDIRQRLF